MRPALACTTLAHLRTRFAKAALYVDPMLLALLPLVSAAPTTDDRLANGVADWVEDVSLDDFSTGSVGFDREWHFGTWQMAALGFAQHAQAHPEARAEDLRRMEVCIDHLLGEEGRAFDRRSWGQDPVEALTGTGHVAWLGYTNLALSAHRALVPDSRYAALNDKISDALAAGLALAPNTLPETYPGERYPVDTAAAAASVGLHDRATGRDHHAALAAWTKGIRERWTVSGLLVQSIRPDGTPLDQPRGSGTFLASWFVSWWDPALARDLYVGGRDVLYQPLGFASAMREYLPDVDGRVDIDSGPIIAGLGVSSTGFAIGAARASGDLATAAELTRLAEIVGRPYDVGDARHWATGADLGGAPLADAILFAMLGTPVRVEQAQPSRR